MMTMLLGMTAILVGLSFLAFWWPEFITVVMAAVPVILVIGGALAAYLGYEEWKDVQKMAQDEASSHQMPAGKTSETKTDEGDKVEGESAQAKETGTEGNKESQPA